MIRLIKLILEISDKNTTNKITIGKSVLYGVVHGKNVQIDKNQYPVLKQELESVGGQTFYEGPANHENITQKLLDTIGVKTSAESWEPPTDTLTGDAQLGFAVAGWWGQSITQDDDGGETATNNIVDAWKKTGLPLDATIGDAFKKSLGNLYDTIISRLTDYSKYKRYSKKQFLNTLNQRGFDDNGKVTPALKDFNAAGHDQIFPEDNDLPPGGLKKTEQAFNLFRDKHLIHMMETKPGIYFAGSGHLNYIRNILK